MALTKMLKDHQYDYRSTWGKHDCVSTNFYGNPFNSFCKIFFKTKGLNLIVVLEDHQRQGDSSSGNHDCLLLKTLGQFTQEKLRNFSAEVKTLTSKSLGVITWDYEYQQICCKFFQLLKNVTKNQKLLIQSGARGKLDESEF